MPAGEAESEPKGKGKGRSRGKRNPDGNRDRDKGGDDSDSRSDDDGDRDDDGDSRSGGSRSSRSRSRRKPPRAAKQAKPSGPPLDAKEWQKKAWKLYLADMSEEGTAMFDDQEAKKLSRRCFDLAAIFLRTRDMLIGREEAANDGGKDKDEFDD